MTKRKQNQGLRLLVAQSSQKGCGWCVCFCLPSHLSSVFFCVVAPIHWETDLREAYASLRGVKGSLRGGVLFGVAYAGGYARIFLPAGLKKSALRQLCLLSQKWLHYLSFWPFVASFPFILAFCCFIYFCGGPMAGALSCLRKTYAEVTRCLRRGSW